MIHISGKDYILTDKEQALRITGGLAALFFVDVDADGRPGRRYPLVTLSEGEIPAVDIVGTEGRHLRILIQPIDPVSLEEIPNTRKIEQDFLNALRYEEKEGESFEDSIRTLRQQIADGDRQHIADSREYTAKVRQDNLKAMRKIIRKGKIAQAESSTGNLLFDAVSKVCGYQKIEVPGLNTVQKACGESFSVSDIARIGGFVQRDILLENGWEKNDVGAVLGYYGVERIPVAVLPGRHGYSLWRPDTGETEKVTSDKAEKVSPGAAMFYKPFERKKIGVSELAKYILPSINADDVIRLILMMVFMAIGGMLINKLNEMVYDSFIPAANKGGLIAVCAMIISMGLGNIAFTMVQNLSNIRLISRVKYAVQAATMDRLMNLPESFVKKYDSAELAQRALGISGLLDAFQSSVVVPLLTAAVSLMYITQMNTYSREMTQKDLILLGIYLVIVVIISLLKKRLSKEMVAVGNRMTSMLTQYIGGIDKLRISGAETRAVDRYMRLYTQETAIERSLDAYDRANGVVMEAFPNLCMMFFYFLAVTSPGTSFTMGYFMAFTTAATAFNAAMMKLASSLLNFTSLLPVWENLKPILSTLPEHDTSLELPGKVEGDIRVEAVTFGYNPEQPVLKNLNIHIRTGEYVAIVGMSGCGKSTLLKLLLGFEKPQEGRIYYDDKDIENVDKRELRKKMGVVLQNGDTINASIYDNIIITAPNVTREAVEEAIEASSLKPVIDKLPMGLNTLITEGDGGLSGGQKQRVLIARALVAKPSILFFDEATSALDNKTQNSVSACIDRLECTRVVIAQRLSTIVNCDRILVMDQGRIAEEGNYQQLMEKKGLFYDMVIRQVE